jgi:hypothetical protein
MAGPLYTGSSTGPGSGGASAPTYTWANRPAVGTIGSRIYISDVGEYGAEFVSNGSTWSHIGTIEIIQKGKGWLVPSLAAANAATYSQSGTTITVTSTGHNIPDLKYNTKDVYLNMGTAATGATIPPGWFSNFTYISANSFTCISTVSQTGTGAVNTNLAEITPADITAIINGNLLGLDGKTIFSYLASTTGSASAKRLKMKFGTTAIIHNQGGVSVAEVINYPIANRHNANSQVYNFGGFPVVIAEDTTADITCSFSMQCDVANDYSAIHAASVYISIS